MRCIIGTFNSRQVAPLLMDLLRRFDYNGYDSAGIAMLVDGRIEQRRVEGQLARLAGALSCASLAGTTGIDHTRWVVCGAPIECNTHPHGTARASMVHNGIIENHADDYTAGETKHGRIAPFDGNVPVIAIALSCPLFEKTTSNLQEDAARGGQIMVFSNAAGVAKLAGIAAGTIVLASVDPFAVPILYAIAVHLLAYHVALLKSTDIDQSRNFTQSVTVE